MTTYAALVRWCTTCEDDVGFEQPGCVDDHGGDCPEWVCVQCGDALLIGFPVSSGPAGPARVLTSHVA